MKNFMAHLVNHHYIDSGVQQIDIYFTAISQDDAENIATSLAAYTFDGIDVVSVHEL